MAGVVLIFLGILYGSQAIPAPGHGMLAGYCKVTSDCASDECCVSFTQPKGKRETLQTLPPELMALVDGTCQKRGLKGSYCIVDGGISPGVDGLYYDCPCVSDQVCKGTGQQLLYKGELGYCSEPVLPRAVPLSQPCSTGADCADTECCVSDFQPIGKRSEERSAHGHCQPLHRTGEDCLVRYQSGQPQDIVFRCPCMSGLKCNGTGLFEVPIGEHGKCV